MFKYLFTLVCVVFAGSGFSQQKQRDIVSPMISFSMVANYPHDPAAYTQGLLYKDGLFYESTGLFGLSGLRKVDLQTGQVVKKHKMDTVYFGEGLTLLNDKLYQLTYTNYTGFVYDLKTLKRTGKFSFNSDEGWGLCNDGINLIMSDGTNILTWLEPVKFKKVKAIKVFDERGRIELINEMEFIDGFIYANVYKSDCVIKIDPATGKIVGQLDLRALAKEAKTLYPAAEETNGIAYDKASGLMYVTGKKWPKIYALKFEH